MIVRILDEISEKMLVILEPVLPPRVPIDAEQNYQPPRPPPRSLSLSNRFVSESLL